MSSPTFGIPTSGNNAPPPPMGNTNPTGTNNGVGFGGASFPNYPIFGAPNSGSPPTPSSNAPLWSGTSGGLAILSSGFSGNQVPQNLLNELNSTYGSGAGNEINNLLTTGLFNPQTAAAFLNAMSPANAQGLASVQNSFGAEGSRFGSAASLGIGNYESQVNLNEQQTLASMFQNAQTEQLQLLEGVLPTLHSEHANQGSWIDDLIGGVEIAGSIAAAPFTGGASLLGLGAGLSELNAGVNKGTGTPTNNSPAIPSFGVPGMNMGSMNTGTFGSNAPSVTSGGQFDEITQWDQSASAAQSLGGAAPGTSDSFFTGLL